MRHLLQHQGSVMVQIQVQTRARKLAFRNRWQGILDHVPLTKSPYWACKCKHTDSADAEFCALEYAMGTEIVDDILDDEEEDYEER